MLRTITLGDLGRIITGKTPPTRDKENYGGIIPFITPVDMVGNRYVFNTERYVSAKGLKTVQNCYLPAHAICVSCIGSDMGKVVVTSEPSVTNQQINSIVVSSEYDYMYVFYLLRTLEDKIKSLGKNATAVPILNKTKFSNIEIQVHDLERQQSIASILSVYDDLIENKRKQMKLLEEAAQRIYKEWFVDLRFPGYETTPIVDGIPEGWKNSLLADIDCSLESGSRPKGGIDSSILDGIASVGAENVIGLGQYNFSSEKMVSKDFYYNMKRGKIKNRDILIYKDGAYIGRTSLFQDGFPHKEAAVNEHVFLLHATDEDLQYYLFFTLYQNEYYQKMQKLNRNSAQPGINSDSMKSLPLIVPDKSSLSCFNKAVSPLVKKIFAMAKQNRHLEIARNLLLPKLMSGEIEVQDEH